MASLSSPVRHELIPNEKVTRGFWDRVTKTDDCWLWVGATNGRGYGRIRLNAKTVYAHRYSYVLSGGTIMPWMELDHLCETPACVRPDHLQPVTHRENIRRGFDSRPHKTHCPKGHEYTPPNTMYVKGGKHWVCKACRHDRARALRVKGWAMGKPRKNMRPVKVTKDGREICNLKTSAGKAEYERRKDVMYENQKGVCSIVPHWMPRDEATFEHTDLRSGGRRNDAIEYTKPNGDKIVNTVACGYHNGQKGSKRT